MIAEFTTNNADINLIEDTKKLYDNIYMINVCEQDFIFREISRNEFKKLCGYYPDEYEREEVLCQMCVLDPVDIDYTACPAGVPFTIATAILYESGYGSSGEKINNLIAEYSNETRTFENQVSAIITEAFSTVTLEDIDSWSTEKIIKYYTIGQYKLEHYRGITFTAPEGQDTIVGDPNDFPELRGGK